jgi:hypothetical protein
MKLFNNLIQRCSDKSTHNTTYTSFSNSFIKQSANLLKKGVGYSSLALVFFACDIERPLNNTNLQNPNQSTATLGQLQGALQLAPDMNCHTFNLVNQDTEIEELSIDLTQLRLMNGRYSFQRSLNQGAYTLIGHLTCSDSDLNTVEYNSFPKQVNISADEVSTVSFDFVFNGKRKLDQINLQLCAEFVLSALSHVDQACIGDTVEADYEVRWISNAEECQALDLNLSFNGELQSVQELSSDLTLVSIAMPTDHLSGQGVLDLSLQNPDGSQMSLHQQNLSLVQCGEGPLLDDQPIDQEDQPREQELPNIPEHLESFLKLSDSPYAQCAESQNLQLVLAAGGPNGVIKQTQTYNHLGQMIFKSNGHPNDLNPPTQIKTYEYNAQNQLSRFTFSNEGDQFVVHSDASYDDFGRLVQISEEFQSTDPNMEQSDHTVTTYDTVYTLDQKVSYTFERSIFSFLSGGVESVHETTREWRYHYNNLDQLAQIEVSGDHLGEDGFSEGSTLVNYEYDEQGRVKREIQEGTPIKSDLSLNYAMWAYNPDFLIAGSESTYEYANELTYKASTFYTADPDQLPIASILEVISPNKQTLHYEIELQNGVHGLFTTHLNEEGDVIAQEAYNLFSHFTPHGQEFHLNVVQLEEINTVDPLLFTTSDLTCED